MPRFKLFYYGWVIVGFTFALQFVAVGLSYYAFSVFLKPLAQALDTDRFLVSLVMSIQAIMIGLLSPFAARLFANYPIKPLLVSGVACLSLGFVCLSQVTALWQLYVFFGGLVGLGSVLLGVIPSNLLLANWFAAKRGTAMGISQFGLTISGSILVPVVTWLLISYDWQTAFLYCGIGAAVILLPLIVMLAIKTPEEVSLFPDGASQAPHTPPALEAVNWTFRRALVTKDIWYLTFVIGPCYMGIASVILAMPSHITDLGISALEASSILTTTIFMGAIAKPLFGTLSDYFNKKAVVACALALQASGVGLLLGASSYTAIMVAGLFFGLGYGAMSPMWAVLLAHRFGRNAYAAVMGANLPLLMPFNILGLPITTFIFEQTGSYLPAFTGLLGMYVIAFAALTLFSLEARPASQTMAEL